MTRHCSSRSSSPRRSPGRATRRLRTLSALAVGVVVLGITVAGFLVERGVPIPGFLPTSLHGVCPFGGVATIGRLLTGGLYVPRTGAANLFALGATLGMTLFIGAFFCGWLCPLGAVQEWVRSLGRKIGIFPKSAGLPFSGARALAVDRALGYLRYGTLALILFVTYRGFNLAFAAVDPFYALFHFWTGTAMPAALAVLGLTLLLSLFVHRPWCRWLCPFGAVQGLVQKIAPWKIRRDEHLCIGCGACDRACPMNIAVSQGKAVADSRCNRCLSCLAACPRPGALRLGAPALRLASPRRARRPALATAPRPMFSDVRKIAAVVLIAFLGPLAAGAVYRHASAHSAHGAHAEPVPAAFGAAAAHGGLEQAGLEAAAARPEQAMEALSGSLSLAQAAELIRVAPETLLKALDLPGTFELSVKLRDLEEHEQEKTYRWVRERIEALLRGEEFTQASRNLREPSTRGMYLAYIACTACTDQDSGGLT